MAERIDPSQLSGAKRAAVTPRAAVDSPPGTSMSRHGARIEGGAGATR